VPAAVPSDETLEAFMAVIIGVDPHKATHTAVAISGGEEELGRKKVRAGGAQAEQLVAWAEPFRARTWAIESAGGLGYLLAQQLVAAGETVVDVPATLASRVRVLSTGRSDKNDPNDALSVAIAALRSRGLRRVDTVGHSEVLRLLAKRNTDIGNHRTRLVCRMHALLAELAGGGITKEINASDVDRFLEALTPANPVEQTRYDLAIELLDDIRRLDTQLKASHKRIRDAVRASGTTVTDLFGVGPILAAMVIGYSADIARFATRDRYAAYNGTAPVEFSSGGRVVHRVSERGNRQLNHAIHMAAICQLRQPHSEGRAYFDRRVAQGKTTREALRALKRHVSNAVYRRLIADARRAGR
jgi:transposase